MKRRCVSLVFALALMMMLPSVGQANSGDFDGGVAIGSSYAGVDTAPTNGLIVQGIVGIGTASPAGTLDVEGGTAASGNGSNINLYAQNGQASGNTNGGNIILMPGTAHGTGTSGGVGIGLTNPLFPLVVQLTSQYGPAIDICVTNYSGSARANMQFDNWSIGQDSQANGTKDFYFYQGAGNAMRLLINTSGNVGIGNTSPSHLLHVGSSSASGIVLELQNSSGACTHNPGSSSETVSCSSDIRLKADIQDSKDALAWVDDMRIRDFTVKATGERKRGVIAQEVMLKHPEMVHENEEGTYLVDEPNPWNLVKAIQEQQAEIDELKQTLKQLRESH
jgi:hypothetical protein